MLCINFSQYLDIIVHGLILWYIWDLMGVPGTRRILTAVTGRILLKYFANIKHTWYDKPLDSSDYSEIQSQHFWRNRQIFHFIDIWAVLFFGLDTKKHETVSLKHHRKSNAFNVQNIGHSWKTVGLFLEYLLSFIWLGCFILGWSFTGWGGRADKMDDRGPVQRINMSAGFQQKGAQYFTICACKRCVFIHKHTAHNLWMNI